MSEELIWPPKRPRKRRQGFVIAGRRSSGEPALLPCYGVCSKPSVTWTAHQFESGTWYKCSACGQRRPWGLGYWGN